MAKFPILLIAAACMTGCVSVVDVKKVAPTDNAPKGITYHLPQVFLMLTPAKDGSMTVEPLYLPDPAHRYSVTAYSVLGNYTIDVKRTQEGFLETVSFNSDTTGVAKQLLSSGATVRGTEIETDAANAKAKSQEDKAAAEKAAANIAAAEKARADAAVAVQVAQSKADYLSSLAGSPSEPEKLREQIVAAELALREAQVKYSAALTVQNDTIDRYKSANAPADTTLKAPEPMFLKVKMSPNSVRIEPAFVQKDRETWKIPVESKDPIEFEILPNSVVVRPAARTGALVATVNSTVPVFGYVLKQMIDVADGKPLAVNRHPSTGIQLDRTSIRIDLPKATPNGTYKLNYTFTIKKDGKDDDKSAVITVKVER